mmetsp:Transcript_21073/g.39495  ORF Transcript_21073/g.39495 Transcript_21073/m.39495 type:complete len:272 (-) Transcript_21073:1472-2287(-)
MLNMAVIMLALSESSMNLGMASSFNAATIHDWTKPPPPPSTLPPSSLSAPMTCVTIAYRQSENGGSSIWGDPPARLTKQLLTISAPCWAVWASMVVLNSSRAALVLWLNRTPFLPIIWVKKIRAWRVESLSPLHCVRHATPKLYMRGNCSFLTSAEGQNKRNLCARSKKDVTSSVLSDIPTLWICWQVLAVRCARRPLKLSSTPPPLLPNFSAATATKSRHPLLYPSSYACTTMLMSSPSLGSIMSPNEETIFPWTPRSSWRISWCNRHGS